MPRKTTECPTCGATLPTIKGEIQSCPECGMPIDLPEYDDVEEVEEEEAEEEEAEADYE